MSEPPRRNKRKKKKLPAWTHGAVYAGVRAGAAAINIAGVGPSTRGLASFGGAFVSMPFNRKRLELREGESVVVLPEWDARGCIGIRSRRTGICSRQRGRAPRLLTEDGYAAHIELGELEGALKPLLEGEPTLLLTGHCGNWEMLGYTVALLGFPVHALYRPMDMKPVDTWVRETRGRRWDGAG
ncbi:MAG: hypothetical protein R3B46_05335 [Phycisphaerales bacterium]